MREQDTATSAPADSTAGGLYLVALLEGAKGVLVLLTGFGILSLIHRDLHQAALQLLQYVHYNPNSRYSHIFVDLASRTTDLQLWALAAAALLYAAVRLIEAWGLWNQQQWAEWFGLVSGGIYIPIELYEVMKGATWFKIAVLMINSMVIIYLLMMVLQARREQQAINVSE